MLYPIFQNLAALVAHISGGSLYGNRTDPVVGGNEFHNGVDMGVPVGTPIFSPLDGSVAQVFSDATNGNALRLDHTGNKDTPDVAETAYAHLSGYGPMIYNGAPISKGQIVAYTGGAKGAPGSGKSTGPHLHFVVRHVRGGNSTDPMPYLLESTGFTPAVKGAGILTGFLLLTASVTWYFFKH